MKSKKHKFFWGGEVGKLGRLNLQTQLYHRPICVVDKYFKHGDGNPCLYINSPKVRFLFQYQDIGEDIFNILDSTDYIKYSVYQFEPKIGKKAHRMKFKLNRARRLIDVYESVKKWGYCSGKKYNSTYAIHVKRGFYSKKYGDDSDGSIVLRRHHRAAACVALGIEDAPCLFYEEKERNHYKV